MDRKVIGFVGINKAEYLLYISRVLKNLGKKVLLIDCSENGALALSVPSPKGMTNVTIDYRGVYFADHRSSRVEQSENDKDLDFHHMGYDCILVDYGFDTLSEGLKFCDKLICVTDQQIFNIDKLKDIRKVKDVSKALVVRDIVNHKIGPDYITEELSLHNLEASEVFSVSLDEYDVSRRLDSQYDDKFIFKKLSKPLKMLIQELSAVICPDIPAKDIEVAYRKAERGE